MGIVDGPMRRAGLMGLALLSLVACPGSGDDAGIDFSGSATAGSTGASTTAPSSDSVADSTGAGGTCSSDADCQGDPAGEVCDLGSGVCGPACLPEATRPCYSGPDGTDGVGACTAGVNTCTDEGRWSLWCDGEVLPDSEECGNEVDDDCDGMVDDSDADSDGFGVCSGDCCDVDGACINAQLVNPGAYEVVGNELDDDCDGQIDEVPEICDQGLSSNSSNPLDYAVALDLCQTTQEKPNRPSDRTWGVIDASLTRADGSGVPVAVQRSLRSGFGDLVDPEHGSTMVVLSSGNAADLDDTNPDFAPFETGQNLGTSSPVPADWLAANGGVMPNPAGCIEPWNNDANDSVMLTLRMRAPTNASSFSVMTFFFSAEYPEWVCSQFNDFFVALIDSTAPANPPDKNIAIYDDDGTQWPLGVNLVMVADGLFTQCENGPVGCASMLGAEYFGCVGDNLLAGSGFDQADGSACDPTQQLTGGGTGWLRMSGNVTPGEIFEIRFAIWDTSGHLYDSLVLLDDWQWSVEAAEPGVAPG